MKVRAGFVSNSSSTSFYITNKSNVKKTLRDFVEENPQLIEQFKKEYDWYAKDPRFTQENMLKDAGHRINFEPGETRECVFGDEDGTLVGQVFDYILRDGGSSESFSWRFNEYLR